MTIIEGCRGLLYAPSGVASLLRTAAEGSSFFAGVFLSIGKDGGRPSSVTRPPARGIWVGEWVGLRVIGGPA